MVQRFSVFSRRLLVSGAIAATAAGASLSGSTTVFAASDNASCVGIVSSWLNTSEDAPFDRHVLEQIIASNAQPPDKTRGSIVVVRAQSHSGSVGACP